jgi:predicted membrane channel-forming protein YqfA (hemolysin III family)
MSKFKDLKAQFDALDEDDKPIVVIGTVVGLFILIGLLSLVVALVKELFVPVLIVVALYSAGVKFFGWPIPSFVKKLFK